MARPRLGVVLPNYGEASSPAAIRRIAAAAEELGFESVWATEHIVVGPEGADRYGRTYDPFATLSWIAGWTERIELGTSIVLLPLHSPHHVAKQVATLGALAGRRVHLGIGVGWHEDEFRFLGAEFAGRGRRADEGIALMRALWAGESSFAGTYWQFADATFAPLPPAQPEIWIGGAAARSIRRAVELGDVWHPTSTVEPAFVRAALAAHPGLRVVPRTTPERVEEFLELGAEGAVVAFDDVGAMRTFAARHR
jgi:probable F420-dependent oxidoreductase